MDQNNKNENYIRTEIEKYDVPNSLSPEEISKKLSSVKQEKPAHNIVSKARIITAVAACFIVAIISAAVIGSGILSPQKNNDESAMIADSDNSGNPSNFENTDASGKASNDGHDTDNTESQTGSDSSTVIDSSTITGSNHTTYSDIYDTLNTHYIERYANRTTDIEKDFAISDVQNESVAADGAVADGAMNEADSDGREYSGSDSATAKADSASEAASDSASTGSADYTDTDIQVEGVMESDIVKTDGNYIYVLKNPNPYYTYDYGYTYDNGTDTGIDNDMDYRIIIYKLNGEKAEKISTIKLNRTNDYNVSSSNMYLSGGKLILIGTETDDKKSRQYNNNTLTKIYVYDVSDPSNPSLLTTHTQSGQLADTRVSDGYLYTFSNYNVMNYNMIYEGALVDETDTETATADGSINDSDEEKIDKIIKKGQKDKKKKEEPGLPYDEEDTEAYIPLIDGKVIPEDRMYLPDDTKDPESYLVMTSLNIDAPDKIEDKAASLGWSFIYYVSSSNIYITRVDYGSTSDGISTTIDKYHYDKGKLSYKAHAIVNGYINNSYCMHEYKDHFVYVYTAENYKHGNYSIYNGIAVLDENLKKKGSIDNLGIDEEIKSSYYIDNMAYFVTYRNTDPVFAVDISDPSDPVLKSELKIPGFSEYLHSFGTDEDGNTLLIGLGKGNKEVTLQNADDTVNEDRVKISLFTVAKDGSVTETKKHWEAKETYCQYYDRHEVFIDEANSIIGYSLYEIVNDSKSLTGIRHSYVLYRYENGNFKRIYKHVFKEEHIYEGIRGLRINDIFFLINTHSDKEELKGEKLL